MHAAQRSASSELAGFISGASAQIDPTARQLAKLHILDTLGCQVGFASLPWSRVVFDYATEQASAGPATISYYGAQATDVMAAFANASFAHGFEMDDTHMGTASHPGVVVVPAALAVGQGVHASGADFLTAVTVGYEVMVRVGLASVGMIQRGFHTTSVTGPFGSAAAAAVLWSMDADRIAHGLGVAASKASGITEYSASGGSVKRVHAGLAAQSGIESMRMARAGVTAPTLALEGKRGLLRAVSDVVDADAMTRGLGEVYEMCTTGLKPYCCCAGQHTVIDAMTALQRAHPDLGAETIRRIRVRQNPREADVVGRVKEPTDITGSQFSAAFGIALRLVKGGNGFTDYLGARLDDEELLAIARLVDYESTAGQTPLVGDGPCEVRVEMQDGRVLEADVAYAAGTSRKPMSEAEVVAKFHDVADGPLGQEGAARVVETVMGLEGLADVNTLARMLVARPGAKPPLVG